MSPAGYSRIIALVLLASLCFSFTDRPLGVAYFGVAALLFIALELSQLKDRP